MNMMVQSTGSLSISEVFWASSPMANVSENLGKGEEVEWGEIRLKNIQKSDEWLYVEYSNWLEV